MRGLQKKCNLTVHSDVGRYACQHGVAVAVHDFCEEVSEASEQKHCEIYKEWLCPRRGMRKVVEKDQSFPQRNVVDQFCYIQNRTKEFSCT